MKFFLYIIIAISLFSCKKNQTGGRSKISGLVAHHGVLIPNARVYIKFNANEFPGDDYSLYDTYIDADEHGKYDISFYKGTYYLYAKGYDYNIPYPHLVKGGLSVTLRHKENLKKDIAVTED